MPEGSVGGSDLLPENIEVGNLIIQRIEADNIMTSTFFVDGEKCMALGWENYRNANVGDAYLVVHIEQGGLQYAMKA
ncbi:MAG: hypothetical protein LUC50_04320 [Ruminococcus sp.]|nr:hypothetical protein [Ruminococcus sp.]